MRPGGGCDGGLGAFVVAVRAAAGPLYRAANYSTAPWSSLSPSLRLVQVLRLARQKQKKETVFALTVGAAAAAAASAVLPY